ncbi:TPA: hypothetical protein ACGO9W_001957 [Streptococcus suis]
MVSALKQPFFSKNSKKDKHQNDVCLQSEALFDKVFSYFCPKFALIVKKSLDMNVYYGRIGLRKKKGVKQMNTQLVLQQAIFYHTLLSKQENRAH